MKEKDQSASPPKLEIVSPRIGKDEMNLVEHPFATLKRTSDTVLHLEWEKIHPRTGKKVRSSWRVEGSGEMGLPGPVEERLYLVLMEMSREQGWPEKVMFSRHDVLQRLGMSKTASAYQSIHDSLLRLKSVTIDAKRSFWKTETDDFAASLQFNILDQVELIDEQPGRRKGQVPLALSSVTWSRVLQQSFNAGNLRTLHVDFALSLTLPLSARLYRYLDKHRTGDTEKTRNKYEIELHRLCEIHLGMTKAKYASKLKERLLPALEELKTRNFLSEWAFEPMKTAPGEEKAVFYFSNAMLEMASKTAPEINPIGELLGVLSGTPGTAPALNDLDEDFRDIDAANDQVFAGLDQAEKDEINAKARAEMPEILQFSMSSPGAKRTMDKNRRAIVWTRYRSQVQKAIKNL